MCKLHRLCELDLLLARLIYRRSYATTDYSYSDTYKRNHIQLAFAETCRFSRIICYAADECHPDVSDELRDVPVLRCRSKDVLRPLRPDEVSHLRDEVLRLQRPDVRPVSPSSWECG